MTCISYILVAFFSVVCLFFNFFKKIFDCSFWCKTPSLKKQTHTTTTFIHTFKEE